MLDTSASLAFGTGRAAPRPSGLGRGRRLRPARLAWRQPRRLPSPRGGDAHVIPPRSGRHHSARCSPRSAGPPRTATPATSAPRSTAVRRLADAPRAWSWWCRTSSAPSGWELPLRLRRRQARGPGRRGRRPPRAGAARRRLARGRRSRDRSPPATSTPARPRSASVTRRPPRRSAPRSPVTSRRRRRRPPRAAHRPRLGRRSRPLRRVAARPAASPLEAGADATVISRFLEPGRLWLLLIPVAPGRRVPRGAAHAPALRRALHQRRPARRGRARPTRAGAATCPPPSWCWA